MSDKLKLWYKEAATEWVESLPLGNGRLGAMVSGDVYNERIALNEDTLWTGIPKDNNNHEAINYIDEVRNLILNEQYYEAQELMNNKLLAGYTESYAPMGDLYLKFNYNDKNYINIKEASSVTLVLVANTSFNGFDKEPGTEGKDEELLCKSQLKSLEDKSYEEIESNHIDDYRKLFNRVEFCLGNDDYSYLPTNERLERLKNNKEDLGLISLYFQYGRYLLISSSREGSQPVNLQGIWNEDLRPAWSSNYTVNINTEMNYWGAETCNLSECHNPLFNMLKDLSVTGASTAKTMFNCNGWTTNHNVDLWRYSSTVQGSSEWGFWPMGGAWMCQHLWEHYDFTRDKNFLKNEAYPIMKGAAIFLLDYLIEDKDGNLVTCPSTSPENNFLDNEGRKCCASMMSTMDISIIRDLFNNCIAAINVLKVDNEFKEELQKALGRLPKYKVNKFGAVQEWYKDFDEYEPGHRHMSHLFALYPGREISEKNNFELLEASKKTLERRLNQGGGHTGWSCAWIINFYARLKEAELANKYLHVLLKNLTFMNLFCVHPPFQIDGNFGGTAGIAEMLIQSHTGIIEILPAIPKAWRCGYIKGLKARGGFVIDFKWDNNEITKLSITSKVGGKCKIKFGKKYIGTMINESIEIDTIAGKKYRL